MTEDELETLREALVALRRAEALELPSYLHADQGRFACTRG